MSSRTYKWESIRRKENEAEETFEEKKDKKCTKVMKNIKTTDLRNSKNVGE